MFRFKKNLKKSHNFFMSEYFQNENLTCIRELWNSLVCTYAVSSINQPNTYSAPFCLAKDKFPFRCRDTNQRIARRSFAVLNIDQLLTLNDKQDYDFFHYFSDTFDG